MFDSIIHVPVGDADIRLSIALPPEWSWKCIPVPSDAPSTSAAGRLTERLRAVSEDGRCHLQVAASRMPLPMGLAPVVVYWTSQDGLSLPEDDARWGKHAALGGWSTLPGAGGSQVVAATWLQVRDSVIELRLDGPEAKRERLAAVWSLLQRSFDCEPLAEHTNFSPRPTPWWTRVQALRSQGRLVEAIAVAERVDQAEALVVLADLHAERVRRACDAQQLDAARDAWRRATACARAYAASATSGGEGAARSLETQRLLAELGPEP